MSDQPVYKQKLFDGAATIAVYGTSRNWNFAGASRAEMEAKNPGIADAISAVMGEMGVIRAFVPKPTFNARVVLRYHLEVEVLPFFYRGQDADGVLLTHSDDAYFLASADCLAAIVYDPCTNELVGLHCGRDALIDRNKINGGDPREFASVIDAGINKILVSRASKLGSAFYDTSSLRVFLAAGIGPEVFIHPTTKMVMGADGTLVGNAYADANARMIDFLLETFGETVVPNRSLGTIDLRALATAQLVRLGVHESNIQWDGHDTATDTDTDGNFLFHSNRRDRVKRNLVVVRLN